MGIGKKQETLQGLIGCSKSVKKPSTFVVEILKELYWVSDVRRI